MAEAGTQFAAQFNREWLAHSIRTTIAAIVSLEVRAMRQLGQTSRKGSEPREGRIVRNWRRYVRSSGAGHMASETCK